MAQVFSNAKVTVGTVDLSDQADTVTIEGSFDGVDVTTFGSQFKAVAPGLGDAKITVDFFQNFASGKVHSTLLNFFNNSRAGTPGSVQIVPVNTTVSATNPSISLPAAYLLTYNPLVAGVSDASKLTAEFVNAGTAGLTYGTI